MGPTASAKHNWLLNWCNAIPEIVSVDSAMVYKGMDIGTAKPGPDICELQPSFD